MTGFWLTPQWFLDVGDRTVRDVLATRDLLRVGVFARRPELKP